MANIYQDLLADFPWLKSVGIDPRRIQQLVATSSGTSELMTKLRNEPAWRSRFTGNYRQDGSTRMSEAEYIRTEQDYRTLLRQAGINVDLEYSTPASLVGWFEGDVSPNELRDRLQAWQGVSQGGPRVREAFYVYAELSPSDDDLYEAAVDPAKKQNLINEYNAKVAAMPSGPKAWEGFIKRATQMGQQRIARILSDAQTYGATKGATIQRVLEVDPAFAQDIMKMIYGGDATSDDGHGTLSLNELLDAYEFMTVGAVAAEAGLEMPTKERLAEIRSAGVERQKMIEGYAAFGARRAEISAAAERASGRRFGVEQFEASEFLRNAAATRDLDMAMANMAAAGRDVGSFRFGERNGRIVQSGLSSY